MHKENSLFLLASHEKGKKQNMMASEGLGITMRSLVMQVLASFCVRLPRIRLPPQEAPARHTPGVCCCSPLIRGLRLSLCCLWPKCASPSRTPRVLFTFRALPGSPSPPSFPADSVYLAHVPVAAFITLTQSSACRVSPEAKVLLIPNL